MTKKLTSIVSICLVASMMLASNKSIFAAESGDKNEQRNIQLDSPDSEASMVYMNEAELEELIPQEQEENVMNQMDRPYSGIDSVSEVPDESKITTFAASENTDPNYAYIVQNDTVMQGMVQTENQFRWYAFILNEKSRSTILLQMAESLDADLYLFQLGGTQLNLIGGSAVEGSGVTEYCTQVLEEGTYFFAVSGYSGTGNFAFAYYQSSIDATLEVNDSMETATEAAFDTDIIGVIDHPFDVDYYKVVVPSMMVVEYSIASSDGYTIEYAGANGSPAPNRIDGNMVRMSAGMYYFKVKSPSGGYSVSNTYSVKFRNIGGLASLYTAPIVGIHREAGIIFQSNNEQTVYYVNGNPIDINYQWKEDDSNSYGQQLYDITLRDGSDVKVNWKNDNTLAPKVVHYHYSSKPNITVPSKEVLELTFYGPAGMYYVHCMCTGAYAQNNYSRDFPNVTVLIDPDTGKMIDISYFNYFQEVAMGSHNLMITHPYVNEKLKYYEW